MTQEVEDKPYVDVVHVGLVHRDPCECKVKVFHAISSIKKNISKRRHLRRVQHLVSEQISNSLFLHHDGKMGFIITKGKVS